MWWAKASSISCTETTWGVWSVWFEGRKSAAKGEPQFVAWQLAQTHEKRKPASHPVFFFFFFNPIIVECEIV